jgi:hypothetical protein
MTADPNDRKIFFPVEKDQDGYPPVAGETLWAATVGDGNYRVENIPFLATGVSLGDEVMVQLVDGMPTFKSVTRRGGHSTVRASIPDTATVQAIRDRLAELGATSELSEYPRLVSIDIPPTVDPRRILIYRIGAREEGRLDFEIADIAKEVLEEVLPTR